MNYRIHISGPTRVIFGGPAPLRGVEGRSIMKIQVGSTLHGKFSLGFGVRTTSVAFGTVAVAPICHKAMLEVGRNRTYISQCVLPLDDHLNLEYR